MPSCWPAFPGFFYSLFLRQGFTKSLDFPGRDGIFDPLASASHSTGITGVCCCAQFCAHLFTGRVQVALWLFSFPAGSMRPSLCFCLALRCVRRICLSDITWFTKPGFRCLQLFYSCRPADPDLLADHTSLQVLISFHLKLFSSDRLPGGECGRESALAAALLLHFWFSWPARWPWTH